MHHVILFVAGLVAAGGEAGQARKQEQAFAYRCDDIVVVGRLKNGGWEHVEIADDLLGHGWASATLKIRKRLRGTLNASAIPVRYFNHTYLREDRDFMFLLRKAGDGTYEIARSRLMSTRPHLASSCS